MIDAPRRSEIRIFRDANDELGLPDLMSSTVSTGDINGDGWTDLLVGGHGKVDGTQTEVYLNNAGGGFTALGLADRLRDGFMMADVSSTSIVDVDGDGRADLLLGGFEAAMVQILFQRPDGDFELELVFETDQHPGAKVMGIEVADFDDNGLLDIYLVIKWPSMKLPPWKETIPNALLLAVGARQWMDFTSQIDGFAPCGNKQSFAAQFIQRAVFGQPSVLHVVNDLAGNCLWEVAPASPVPSLEGVGLAEMLEFTPFSMGTDWTFDGDHGDVLLLSVEVTAHLLFSLRDGVLADESARIAPTAKDYVGWGGVFLDADNDGDQDVVIASGHTYKDETVAFSAQWLPLGIPALTSRLLYWEQQPDGAFAHDNQVAGDRFDAESGEFFGVVTADLNRDGCVDLVASLRQVPDRDPFDSMAPSVWTYEDDSWSFDGPGVRVLLNNCPQPANHWAAIEVPDVPGATVGVTLSDGSRRYQAVKGTTGIAARSGGGLVHFGLGPELSVAKADLYHPDGAPWKSTTEITLDGITNLKL